MIPGGEVRVEQPVFGRVMPEPPTMVTDEELKAHVQRVERVEQARRTEGAALAHRVEDIESTARCVHNELARRIERVDTSSADEAALTDLVDRIEGIEDRLDAIESHLD